MKTKLILAGLALYLIVATAPVIALEFKDLFCLSKQNSDVAEVLVRWSPVKFLRYSYAPVQESQSTLPEWCG